MAKSPKPTKLLRLEGTFRPDRHAARAGEVEPEPGFPDPPEWLLPEALAEWKRLAADSGYVTAICKVDRAMLAAYCQLWARFVEGERPSQPGRAFPDHCRVKAAHIAIMTSLAGKLGLNPSDRVKVKGRGAEPATNAWQRLKNGGAA
jgi:phage terminase small subunit